MKRAFRDAQCDQDIYNSIIDIPNRLQIFGRIDRVFHEFHFYLVIFVKMSSFPIRRSIFASSGGKQDRVQAPFS